MLPESCTSQPAGLRLWEAANPLEIPCKVLCCLPLPFGSAEPAPFRVKHKPHFGALRFSPITSFLYKESPLHRVSSPPPYQSKLSLLQAGKADSGREGKCHVISAVKHAVWEGEEVSPERDEVGDQPGHSVEMRPVHNSHFQSPPPGTRQKGAWSRITSQCMSSPGSCVPWKGRVEGAARGMARCGGLGRRRLGGACLGGPLLARGCLKDGHWSWPGRGPWVQLANGTVLLPRAPCCCLLTCGICPWLAGG